MRDSDLKQLTATLVTSYITSWPPSNGGLDEAIEKLPLLIQRVYQALENAGGLRAPQKESAEPPMATESDEDRSGSDSPAEHVSVADPFDSIHEDYLVCHEDGRRVKLLSRHLKSRYGMTPSEYKAKWGLPADYPMVAPAYAALRSDVAKRIGLGAGGRGSKPGKLGSGARASSRTNAKVNEPPLTKATGRRKAPVSSRTSERP
jgi:predicted transcriptional regulator